MFNFETVEGRDDDRQDSEHGIGYLASFGGEDGVGRGAPAHVDVSLEGHRQQDHDAVESVLHADRHYHEIGHVLSVPDARSCRQAHVTRKHPKNSPKHN